MPRGGAAKKRKEMPKKPITEAGPGNLLKEGTKQDSHGGSVNSFLKGKGKRYGT